MRYFIKTKSGEKFELNKVWWTRWINKTNGDFVISWSPDDNPIYIMREEISLGYKIGMTKEEKQDIKKGEK